jgi:hypothetical protein
LSERDNSMADLLNRIRQAIITDCPGRGFMVLIVDGRNNESLLSYATNFDAEDIPVIMESLFESMRAGDDIPDPPAGVGVQ